MLASYVDSIAHKCDIEIDTSSIQPKQEAISATTSNSSSFQPSNPNTTSQITSQIISPEAVHVLATTTTSKENGHSKEVEKEKENRIESTTVMPAEIISLLSSSSSSSSSVVREENVVDLTKLHESDRDIPDGSQGVAVKTYAERRKEGDQRQAQKIECLVEGKMEIE